MRLRFSLVIIVALAAESLAQNPDGTDDLFAEIAAFNSGDPSTPPEPIDESLEEEEGQDPIDSEKIADARAIGAPTHSEEGDSSQPDAESLREPHEKHPTKSLNEDPPEGSTEDETTLASKLDALSSKAENEDEDSNTDKLAGLEEDPNTAVREPGTSEGAADRAAERKADLMEKDDNDPDHAAMAETAHAQKQDLEEENEQDYWLDMGGGAGTGEEGEEGDGEDISDEDDWFDSLPDNDDEEVEVIFETSEGDRVAKVVKNTPVEEEEERIEPTPEEIDKPQTEGSKNSGPEAKHAKANAGHQAYAATHESENKVEHEQEMLSDETRIAGTTWGDLKQSAMRADYRSQDWYGGLSKSEIGLLESLRAAQQD